MTWDMAWESAEVLAYEEGKEGDLEFIEFWANKYYNECDERDDKIDG